MGKWLAEGTRRVRPENPANAVPWEGPEGTPLTEAKTDGIAENLTGCHLCRVELTVGDTTAEVGPALGSQGQFS